MTAPKLTYGNIFIGLIILIVVCNQVLYHIAHGFNLNWNGTTSEVGEWEMTTMVIYGIAGVVVLCLLFLLLIENWNKTPKF